MGDHVGAGICTAALQWVDLVWLPYAHPAAPSFPLLNRTRGENKIKKPVG